MTYFIGSESTCGEQDKEKKEDKGPLFRPTCGYCGSTKPLIPYEEMYGPGAVGWDCCPDCGGV